MQNIKERMEEGEQRMKTIECDIWIYIIALVSFFLILINRMDIKELKAASKEKPTQKVVIRDAPIKEGPDVRLPDLGESVSGYTVIERKINASDDIIKYEITMKKDKE